MIEGFSLTFWLHRFVDRYRADRPHSALGYLTPNEYRETERPTGWTARYETREYPSRER